MAPKPVGLGDVKVALKRIQETFDLPENRQGIVARFENILTMGGVQKVVVELGHPIKVDRLVKAGDVGDATELQDDDWMNAVRNGELEEYAPTTKNQFQYLFHAFQMLSQKRLRARILMVHSVQELKTWLGLDSFIDVRELFGVEVKAHPEVPDQTGILIAVNPNESDAVAFSMRLLFEKEKPDEANRGKGAQERNRGQGNGRAPGEVGKPS